RAAPSPSDSHVRFPRRLEALALQPLGDVQISLPKLQQFHPNHRILCEIRELHALLGTIRVTFNAVGHRGSPRSRSLFRLRGAPEGGGAADGDGVAVRNADAAAGLELGE